MESTWKENLTGNTKEVHLYRTAQMHFQERSAVHVERDYMLRTPPIACNGFIEAACHRTGTSSISAHLCDKTSTHSLHCITLHYITFGRWNPSFPRIVPQFGEFQGISGNFRKLHMKMGKFAQFVSSFVVAALLLLLYGWPHKYGRS